MPFCAREYAHPPYSTPPPPLYAYAYTAVRCAPMGEKAPTKQMDGCRLDDEYQREHDGYPSLSMTDSSSCLSSPPPRLCECM